MAGDGSVVGVERLWETSRWWLRDREYMKALRGVRKMVLIAATELID